MVVMVLRLVGTKTSFFSSCAKEGFECQIGSTCSTLSSLPSARGPNDSSIKTSLEFLLTSAGFFPVQKQVRIQIHIPSRGYVQLHVTMSMYTQMYME